MIYATSMTVKGGGLVSTALDAARQRNKAIIDVKLRSRYDTAPGESPWGVA